MNIQSNLLVVKGITPLQKLILALILDTPPAVLQLAGGYDKTCGEMGKLLGESRKTILDEFEALVEHDLITSKKGSGWRITNVTKKMRSLLNCS